MSKLLLVEDDNNLREIYEARLQAEGYTIVTAKDGEEALAVAKAEKPDLIISDVMMPKISGFEMLDILKNTDGLKNVKVIMLTALGQNDDQQRADKLGADRYLVKSQVTLEDIVRVTHELLEDGEAPAPEEAAAAPAIDTPTVPAPEPVAAPEPVVATPPAPEEPTPAPVATPDPVAEPVVAAPAPAPVPMPEPVAAPASEPIATPTVSLPDATVTDATDTTAEEATSTTEESEAVEDQIANFVNGATQDATAVDPSTTPSPEPALEVPTDTPIDTPTVPAPEPVAAPEPVVATPPAPEEPTPAPVATPDPVAEPVVAAPAPAPVPVPDASEIADDKLMNEAVDSLMNEAPAPEEAAAAPVPTISAPASGSAAPKPAEEAEAKPADASGPTMSHGKTISPPPDSTLNAEKPDIQKLFEVEQAKEEAAKILQQPAAAAPVPTADAAPAPAGTPEPKVDPNSIAL
jgi:CheY-like chemotaxis protein